MPTAAGGTMETEKGGRGKSNTKWVFQTHNKCKWTFQDNKRKKCGINVTPLKSFDGVSRALTSLLMSAPASSSIWTMASSPRTQAYMRGVIPCGRKVQAGLIIAAPDVLFKRGKKVTTSLGAFFAIRRSSWRLWEVRRRRANTQQRAEGPESNRGHCQWISSGTWCTSYLEKKALYSAAFQQHGVTGKSCKKTVIYRESNPITALCPWGDIQRNSSNWGIWELSMN